MSVTIHLQPEDERRLEERARQKGVTLEVYLQQLVQREAANGSPPPRPAPTFDEMCAPFARAVEASGMGDEEFDQFIKEVREEVWQEKHGKQS